MFRLFKNRETSLIEDYIKFTSTRKGEAEVLVEFSADNDSDKFGMLLSMVDNGLLSKHIETAVNECGKNNSLEEHSKQILTSLFKYNQQVNSDVESLMDDGDFIAEYYPAIPSWGNPEITDLFDENAIDDSPRKIGWQYLERSGESEVLADDLLEESQEEQVEDKPTKLYAVDGVDGLLSESQFKRLQDSEKPEYDLPKNEMRIAATNFNISLNCMRVIANSPGVERVVVTGRYSFVIAIGRLFEFGEVRRAIEEGLNIEYTKQLDS